QAAAGTRQCLVVGAVAGLAFGVSFVVCARPLLTLIGATDEVAAIGVPILAIVGGTSLFTTVWYIGVSAMSAAGDTRTPMWMAVLSAVLGVPLGYLFLIVLALGPIGAAYASVLDSAVVCVVVLVLLWRGRAGLTIAGGSWRLDPQLVRSVVSVSLPSAAEGSLFSSGVRPLSGSAVRLGPNGAPAHPLRERGGAVVFLRGIGFRGGGSG